MTGVNAYTSELLFIPLVSIAEYCSVQNSVKQVKRILKTLECSSSMK